jgi:thymidylate synthase ThyX
MITVKIIEDSLPPNEIRLTTFSLVYPRFIHAEVMTHRVFSRGAASSRALPVQKVLDQIQNNPAKPLFWGQNEKGMVANTELTGQARQEAEQEWLAARDDASRHAQNLSNLGLHKEYTNRILEPFQLISTIITATDWDNFFNLRTEGAAQPEFIALAKEMLYQLNATEPRAVPEDWWHLPYVTEEERRSFPIQSLVKFATARCARVSYKTHEGIVDQDRDVQRHNELLASGHMSPFEHSACPLLTPERCSNFRGWKQYRKFLPNRYEQPCSQLIEKKRWSSGDQILYDCLEENERYNSLSRTEIWQKLIDYPPHVVEKLLFRLNKWD